MKEITTENDVMATATTDVQPEMPRMKRPDAFYDAIRKDYWMLDSHDNWISVSESSLRRQLRAAGFAAKPHEGQRLSDVDVCLNKIQLNHSVNFVGPLAGYDKGLIEMSGHRILVTRAAKLINPVAGECPVLSALMSGLFGEKQLPFVKGWLKVAYESLRDRHVRPGQLLALAGERNSGKSLFQNLVTEILGGRAAKPYRYMTGRTEFNSDLFGAEHLMIEDEVASTDIRSRRQFGARIKDFTVNDYQSCHAKGREAINLKPFWRVSLSLNDEPENLMILPPLDESLVDKLMLFRVTRADLPMPTLSSEERSRFWKALIAEIPAFVWHLSEWCIPPELQCQRFGIKYYHDPEILDALDQLTPESKLLSIMDHVLWTDNYYDPANSSVHCVPSVHRQPIEATAEELEQRLKSSPDYGFDAKRLLDWTNAMGTYLGRLEKKHPTRIKYIRTATSRSWRVAPPPEEK